MKKVQFYDKVEDSLLRFAVIIARSGDKWVFCKHRERDTYEVPGGHREPGENIDDTARRELYEETGLSVKKIRDILPASFAAVAFSDVTTYIAIVEAEGQMQDHTSENEQIDSRFYTREEVRALIQTEQFSSRAQLAAYFFAQGALT